MFLRPSVFAARTLVVDKEGGDFTTVAEASKEAKPGDTVFIRSHPDSLGALEAFKIGVFKKENWNDPASVDRPGMV